MAPSRLTLGPVSAEGVRVGSVEEVRIEGLSSEGAGVGRLPDGRAIFVPLAAPGDLARVRVDRVKPRWAAGSLTHVLEPGTGRRPPACRLYGTCGGCRLQHLAEDRQRLWKARRVRETLSRLGHLDEVPMPEVVASPASLGYRNRMSFTLRRLRHGRVVAGLYELDHPARIVDVDDECKLPRGPVMDVWCRLRRAWGPGARLLPDGGRLRLTVRLGPSSGPLLEVEGGGGGWEPTPLLEATGVLRAIVHRPDPPATERVVGADPGATASEVPAGFEQVNDGAAELLRRYVLQVAGRPERVVDAYCGSGAWGRALAAAGARVVGIERDPRTSARAQVDAPEGLSVLTGPVEGLLAGALPAELVIVNPPRAGLGVPVADILLGNAPERLVYVSCDPATLARDLAALAPKLVLDELRCFDLFPQTAHVETVVVMHRKRDH